LSLSSRNPHAKRGFAEGCLDVTYEFFKCYGQLPIGDLSPASRQIPRPSAILALGGSQAAFPKVKGGLTPFLRPRTELSPNPTAIRSARESGSDRPSLL